MGTHWALKLAIETNGNGGEVISAGCLTFSVLGRPLYSTTFRDNTPLLGFIWTLPSQGERRTEYKAEGRKCQENQPQRGERRCKRKGEKSRGRGMGDAKRKWENPPSFPPCPSSSSPIHLLKPGPT